MSKQRSKKFWMLFWMIAVIFLSGWFLFWQFSYRPKTTLDFAIGILPISEEKKERLKAVNSFVDYALKKDGAEKTFLILFQNNMELRPGGGYIGSFGILKLKDGEFVRLETHDVVNFDGRIPDTVEVPYPMKETLGINSWKFRDSNFSPDFSENARYADYFYHLGQGQENFDGIIAVNASVLTSFLKVTGPVEIPDYPGTYDSENAIIALEYQVEKGYRDQGLEHPQRKTVMKPLADEIIKKVFQLGVSDKIKLSEIILDDLNSKDIQLNFKDPHLQARAESVNWAGIVKEKVNSDYLMMVDANLGAYKSDYYIKRSFDYAVDLESELPEVNLKITYEHSAKEKDWMTKDYVSYLRIYVPGNSWFESPINISNIRYGEEFNKKYLGVLIYVPLGTTKTFEFSYNLSKDLRDKPYDLFIQKQSGIGTIPGKITVTNKDGSRKTNEIELKGDWKLSDQI